MRRSSVRTPGGMSSMAFRSLAGGAGYRSTEATRASESSRGGAGRPGDDFGALRVGYRSATSTVHLIARELAGHGLTVGGPGSVRRPSCSCWVEASAGQQPVVVVDPKGSPALTDTVGAHGGVVWTLDGKLPARPDGPTTMAGAGPAQAVQRFAVALFEGVDRTAVKQRSLSLKNLVKLLSTSDELANKRRARCWSPTLYADGAKTRANAGEANVSALVFDMDKVPPDSERLAGVCWMDHTT